jgi:hypothetical protein
MLIWLATQFPFLWRFRKLIGYALLAAALVTAFLAYRHSLINGGIAQGRDEVKALWAKDSAARDKATQEAIASALKREDDARKHNDQVVADYAQKLSAAAGSRDEYFSLLQRARNQVRGLAANQGSSAPSPAPTCEATGTERLDSAIAAALVESRENAEQLDALIAVVKPQL